MFAIIDCNNFYASCERLFNPALADKPIVVLSNNDGCVIARSNEAKALGIQMGEPFFRIRGLCQRQAVFVFSSNYAFYGDLSRRVMQVIEESWPEVEIYSIDEAFVDLSQLPAGQRKEFCQALQQKIRRYTGIPVSIGLAPTKTLAKLANYLGKKVLKVPVVEIDASSSWLPKIPVAEVWGVGRQWDKKLQQEGIVTAADLAAVNLQGIRKRFNLSLQKTVLELRGQPCANLAESEPRQSIVASRSFGQLQTSFQALAAALSSHCARAYEKLREQKLLAQSLAIFIQTNRFREDLPQYNKSIGFRLVIPSDDLSYLTRCARFCLSKIYKKGYAYQKVGVYLTELVPNHGVQQDLFDQPDEAEQKRRQKLWAVFDGINHKYGRHTIHLAAEGTQKGWEMRSHRRSPAYTTSWSALPVVRLGSVDPPGR